MAKAQKQTKAVQTKSAPVAGTTKGLDEAKSALAAMDATLSLSAKIRTLSAQGFERGVIAKAVNRRYQHVRNVLITPLKRTADVKES